MTRGGHMNYLKVPLESISNGGDRPEPRTKGVPKLVSKLKGIDTCQTSHISQQLNCSSRHLHLITPLFQHSSYPHPLSSCLLKSILRNSLRLNFRTTSNSFARWSNVT